MIPREAFDPAMGGDVFPPEGRKPARMSAADAARLVLSGDDGWTLLAEDPAYDTRYGAAVRVLAQHVLAPSGSGAIDPHLEEIIDGRVAALAVAAGIDRDGMDWEEVLADATAKLAAASSPATAATPEAVSGEALHALTVGSRFVLADEEGLPQIGSKVRETGAPDQVYNRDYLVLYRAPEPPKPLALDDVLRELDEAMAAHRYGTFAPSGNPEIAESVTEADADDMLTEAHDKLRRYLAQGGDTR